MTHKTQWRLYKSDLETYQHPEDNREFTCQNMTWGNQDALCFMEEFLATERTEVCWFHSDDLRAALFSRFPCFNTRLVKPSKTGRGRPVWQRDERFWERMLKKMSHKCGWIGHFGVYKNERPVLCCNSSKTCSNIPAVMDCNNSGVMLVKTFGWIMKKHFIAGSLC